MTSVTVTVRSLSHVTNPVLLVSLFSPSGADSLSIAILNLHRHRIRSIPTGFRCMLFSSHSIFSPSHPWFPISLQRVVLIRHSPSAILAISDSQADTASLPELVLAFTNFFCCSYSKNLSNHNSAIGFASGLASTLQVTHQAELL